jgi:hypothetical protein
VSWLDTPLPPAERDALLDSLADGLKKRGLATPALFALELHRPLGNTLAHGVLGLTPLLAPVLGVQRLQQAAALLAEPGSIDLLLERLSGPIPPAPFPSVFPTSSAEGKGESDPSVSPSLAPTKSEKGEGKGLGDGS